MLCRSVALPAGPCPGELLRAARGEERAPDLVLAFLPGDEHLPATLETIALAWPGALLAGCEAVSQLAGEATTSHGTLQLFWFERAGARAEARVLPPEADLAPLVAAAGLAGGVLLLADGLAFSPEPFLAGLRRRLPAGAAIPWAGGLASQADPGARPGARIFLGRDLLPGACLAVLLYGIQMRVEVIRGWDSASPVYRVTRARDNVLYEIDGEPATDWFRRFFTVGGELAPLPEAAHRFPLVVEGPAPERRGLYRSVRRFDEPPGAVTFWGNVEPGDRIRLGIGNDRSLADIADIAGSLEAAGGVEAALLYSCVSRQRALGVHAGREVEALHRALPGAALAGFFTFGEIGPAPEVPLAFYNHTAVLVLLSEVRG